MLEEMYAKHCRTLRLGFRLRWSIARPLGARFESSVEGSGRCDVGLTTFYDVELVEDKKDRRIDFFYKYRPSDFRRITDREGEHSHFFGFSNLTKELSPI